MTSITDTTLRFKSEWVTGWRIVIAAGLGVGTGWGFFLLTAGLFIVPMQTEFGWSRSALTIGPLGALVSMLFYPFAGMLIDHFGARRMALIGLSLLSFGFVLLTIVPAKPVVFYAVVVYVSIAGALSNSIVFSKGVATWFVAELGTAIGLMQSGLSVATAMAIPVLSLVIARFGWRAGYLTSAIIILLFGIPVMLLWFRTRAPLPVGSSVTVVTGGITFREALRDHRFWLMALAFGVAALPIGGYLSHLQPLLANRRVSRSTAAALGTIFVVSVGVGRIVLGALFDRTRPSLVAMGSLILSAVGALLLSIAGEQDDSPPYLAFPVSLIGLAQGAESDFVSYFTARIFGVRSFSKLVGVLSMVVGGGFAVGGFIFSALYDRFGDYNIAVRLSVVMYVISAIIFPLIQVPARRPKL